MKSLYCESCKYDYLYVVGKLCSECVSGSNWEVIPVEDGGKIEGEETL